MSTNVKRIYLLHGKGHGLLHFLLHVLHHAVHLTEATMVILEEGVIGKGVSASEETTRSH